jgi:hypothetical protein
MRLTLGTLGQLALASMVTACSGQIHDLGRNTTGGSGFSVGGWTSTDIPIATGGSITTGDSSTTGGAVSTSTPSTGETGGGGSLSPGATPYVLNPTLPIDPTCTCDSSDEVCNAARQCVPRCDDDNHCVRWLAYQPVNDMLVDGTTLYFTEEAIPDPVGNPGTNGALLRVDPSDVTPTLIAGTLDNPVRIIGRYLGTTYVQTQSQFSESGPIVRVTDSGETTVVDSAHGNDGSMLGHWLVYATPDNTELRGIDLDAAQQQPIVLYKSTSVNNPLVMQDIVLFHDSGSSICSVTLANPAAGASCIASNSFEDLAATSGT